MPGMFLAIPGWHHDNVPRTVNNGQPNYKDPQNHTDFVDGFSQWSCCTYSVCTW